MDTSGPLTSLIPRHVTGLMPSLFPPPTCAVAPSLPPPTLATHAGPAYWKVPADGAEAGDGQAFATLTDVDDADDASSLASLHSDEDGMWALRDAEDAPVVEGLAPQPEDTAVVAAQAARAAKGRHHFEVPAHPVAVDLSTPQSASQALLSAVGALSTLSADARFLASGFDLSVGRHEYAERHLGHQTATSPFLVQAGPASPPPEGKGADGDTADSGSAGDAASAPLETPVSRQSDDDSEQDSQDDEEGDEDCSTAGGNGGQRYLGKAPKWVSVKRALDTERRFALRALHHTLVCHTGAPQSGEGALQYHGFQARPVREGASAQATDLATCLLWRGLTTHLNARQNWPEHIIARAEVRAAAREAMGAPEPAAPVNDSSIPQALSTVCLAPGTLAAPIRDLPRNVRFLPEWSGPLPALPPPIAEAHAKRHRPGSALVAAALRKVGSATVTPVPAGPTLQDALGHALFRWLGQGLRAPDRVYPDPATAWEAHARVQAPDIGCGLAEQDMTRLVEQVVASGFPPASQEDAAHFLVQLHTFCTLQRCSVQLVARNSTLSCLCQTPPLTSQPELHLLAEPAAMESATPLSASLAALPLRQMSRDSHLRALVASEVRVTWAAGNPLRRGLCADRPRIGQDCTTSLLTLVWDQGVWTTLVPLHSRMALACRAREVAASVARGRAVRAVLETSSAPVDVEAEVHRALHMITMHTGINNEVPRRVAAVLGRPPPLDLITAAGFAHCNPVDFPTRALLAKRGAFHNDASSYSMEEEETGSRRRSARRRPSRASTGIAEDELDAYLAADSSGEEGTGRRHRRKGGAAAAPLGSPATPIGGEGQGAQYEELEDWQAALLHKVGQVPKPMHVRSLFLHVMGRLTKHAVKWEVRLRAMLGNKAAYEGCFDDEVEAAHHADVCTRAAHAAAGVPTPPDLLNFMDDGRPNASIAGGLKYVEQMPGPDVFSSDPSAATLFDPRNSWTIINRTELPFYFHTRKQRSEFWPALLRHHDFSLHRFPHREQLSGVAHPSGSRKSAKRPRSGDGAARGRGKAARSDAAGKWQFKLDVPSMHWLEDEHVHTGLLAEFRALPPRASLNAALARAAAFESTHC